MLSKGSPTPTRCNESPRLRTITSSTNSRTLANAFDYTSQPASVDTDFFAYNPEKEPIKAYLRLRPPLLTDHHTYPDGSQDNRMPYLQITDDSEVCMMPPEDSSAYRTRNRAPERYRFTKIFTKDVSQQEFFNKTTLPLIRDVLNGENALIFAYGVTNSGKTYSITGTRQDAGLLPRTLDVIFNSIKDYISDSKLKPVMHSLVQAYEDKREENRSVLEQSGTLDTSHFGSSNCDLWEGHAIPENPDTTVIPVDGNFEYGIWVSFAEIYTERIYDLLVASDRQSKRKSLALKYEFRSGHKYIAGLKEVKVKSIEEAYSILHQGQRNRAVFSTLLNQTSSRSHSIFTIRIVRVPIYESEYVIEDPSYAIVSKMSIVDLAGSERYRNTLNSGQRLKEAGNINKSLMVLGQCMETLRLNQLKSAMNRRRAIVPFRHSKLTELFKSSFEGDGKAVMVVNINPTDTGFDENSHVMKFAAVAKDVATFRRVHPKLDLHGLSAASKRRRTRSKGKKVKLTSMSSDVNSPDEEMDAYHLTDDEDDRDDGDEEDDDELEDPFVDNLISQWAELREKWADAETRCATMEAEIRQQVSKEMESELRKMEEMYMSRITRESDTTAQDIKQRLELPSMINGSENNVFLNNLYQRQESLTLELNKMRARVQDNDITKHALLEKISELEKDKRKEQETTQQLVQDVRHRDQLISDLQNQLHHSKINSTEDPMDEDKPASVTGLETISPNINVSEPMALAQPKSSTQVIPVLNTAEKATLSPSSPFATSQMARKTNNAAFDEFLDLRKKLRRAIFKAEQCSSDADVIMTAVENFEGVTFDMVKESNMGKLLKLISQRQFKQDIYHLKQRARELLKQYVKLSIPTLAPPRSTRLNKRDSLIMVSVDAGKEEDLISDMRDAMDVLQDENRKLKSRLKTMESNQRRLMEAFGKPAVDTSATVSPSETTISVNDNDELTSESMMTLDDSIEENRTGDDSNRDDYLRSPVLGASTSMTEEMDQHSDDHADCQRIKRRRKLRIRQ